MSLIARIIKVEAAECSNFSLHKVYQIGEEQKSSEGTEKKWILSNLKICLQKEQELA